MAHDSQIVRAEETSSWATVGQAIDKHPAPTHRLKRYVRFNIESEAWPTVAYWFTTVWNSSTGGATGLPGNGLSAV